MKVEWLPPPNLKRPAPERLDKLVRNALWMLSKGGTVLVHRRTLDREVQRHLWRDGYDAAWLSAGMELRTADNDLVQAYLGTLDVGDSTKLSLVRSVLVAKWGPYYCCLPPRAISVPGPGERALVLSMEPTSALAKRLGCAPEHVLRRGRLRLVAQSEKLESQPWHEVVDLPEGLQTVDSAGALDWLRNEISSTMAGGQSRVLEGGARHPAVHPKSLQAEFTVVTATRHESLETLFRRPPGLWGGFALDHKSRVVAGEQLHLASGRRMACLFVIDNDPRDRHLTPLVVKPFFRRLIMGSLGVFDYGERSVSFSESGPDVTIFGKALRTAQGPFLTWLMLFGGVGTDDRGFASITLPHGAWLVARQLLLLQGTQVSRVPVGAIST